MEQSFWLKKVQLTLEANASGVIPSAFLKALRNVLRLENPESLPIASSVISSPLPSINNEVAALFRSTAEGETGHAHGHLEWLEQCGDPATGLPIGATRDNLKAAVAGETHEYTDMYPGMAKTARDEGHDEIADWFETLAKAERSHANRYAKALAELVD